MSPHPVSLVPLTPAERRLQGFLRVLAALFLAATFLYELGPLVGPFRDFCGRLPFVANSVVKVAVLGFVALYAAGDVRRRLGLVWILIAAHVLSIAAMAAAFGFGADTSRMVHFGRNWVPVGDLLAGAMALDGVIAVLAVGFLLPARSAAIRNRPPSHGDGSPSATAAERRFRTLLLLLGVTFAAAALAYEWGVLATSTRDLFRELPFVTNSVVRAGTLAMLCFYVGKDIRERLPVADILVAAHGVSVLAILVLLLTGAPDPPTLPLVDGYAARDLLAGGLALDGAILVLLVALDRRAWRGRYGLRYLQQMEYRTLMSLADVLIQGNPEAIHPVDVARNVDRYVSDIRAKRRWVYRMALFGMELHPLLYFKAPFSELDPETRLGHIKRHFHRAVVFRLVPDWWRRLVQVSIRVGKQLTYIGYYNDARTNESVGYVRFTDRLKARGEEPPSKSSPRLEVLTSARIPGSTEIIDADVCVIGSGAGGSILTYELAKKGREVLVVERGDYVPPVEFTEDEVQMVGRLYADGVFQQAEDFRFTILQGSCVGGSTTVNNAVCFAPPEDVLRRWNDPAEHDAGLDPARFRASIEEVSRFLRVQPQDGPHLNPSGRKFLEGIARHAPGSENLDVGVVRANIERCLGCGYCNVGCAYGRKLSMLETALPWAQRDFPGKVRILAGSEVVRLRTLTGSPQEILDARARLSDGRRVTIRAKTFVVAAGTVASSWLLLRSGVGRDLPVGRGVSFNMGSPLTAEFDEPLDAHAGLQISHYALPIRERGFVLETWWNPPATQAVNLPGWFEDHFENMRNFRKLMGVGVLVGTKSNARIRRAVTGGPGVVYRPEWDDLRSLADGLAQVGEILFAAGAKRVMANTWAYDVFTHPNQLGELYRICDDPSYITLGTGHPQGGNAISRNPDRGVVDPEFRVHGYGNLYVCDASVFPTSVTVNPQLTVMALAHYAASGIR